MSVVLDILSWALLMTGGAIAVIAGIGVLRLPDMFSRMHASGMLDTLGAACVLLGLILQSGISVISFKLLLVYALLSMTSSTAAHALAKAARTSGHEPDLTPLGAAPSSDGVKNREEVMS
ncbi:Na(+)/H(+) antiporter subunit G [Planctomycetes bacterium Poly30]|uniref:Na(+)/H(+) antiporter subunit G n=1 Tax=Saltatorellus ferox TaxID=2528018 RepID=A0A518EXK0_9BACT|nr:Na(+)/H(+) antiporter subunit G [Planctomycetes bacterium Poly30]